MVDFQKVIGLVDVPNFKSSIVNKYGNTDDIKKAIFEVYNDYKLNTKKVSNLFKEKNIEKTAKNLWLFVRKNIEYEEDPNGKQFVKSPSILVYDRKGDCKSIAIFIASIFHNLGLNHGFRFVGYNKNSNKVTHIYNYVLDENNNKIFVDGCIEQFNILQNNFRFKQDHNMAEIHKVNAPNVKDFIGKFKPYKGNIIAVKNTDNIGFDFGNFFASIDPTTPSNWNNLSNTLAQLDPTASWSLTSRALAWIDPTTNPITRAALVAGLAYYGVPPDMTNNVLNIMAKVGKGQIPAQELQQLLKSQGIADVEGFLKVAKSKVNDPQTQGQFDVIIQQLQKTNSQPNLQQPNLQVEFDENYYLLNNPDVAAAIQRGSFTSGLDHWQQHGKREGRLGAAPLIPFTGLQPNPNGQPQNNQNNDKPKTNNTLLYLALGGAALYLMNSKK